MIFRTQGNVIYATGTIWDGDGVYFMSQLRDLERNYHDITLKLHTIGGSVFDGNLIFNALRSSKADIRIEVIGLAASMGAVLTMSRNKVYMAENAFMMIHAPSGWTDGNAQEHEETAKLLRSIESNFIKKLKARTGKDNEYVSKWMTGDNWFDAEKALKERLISGIIEPETEIENFNPEDVGLTEARNRFAAVLMSHPEKQSIIEKTDMKKLLIAALGLMSVTEESSDTAVVEAVKGLLTAKETELKKQINDLTKAKDKAEGELANQKKETIATMLAGANLTDEEKKTYENIGMTSGVEALQTVLAKSNKPQAPNITGAIQGKTAQGGRADWDFDKWQKEDPQGLEVMAKTDPEAFQILFNQKYQK